MPTGQVSSRKRCRNSVSSSSSNSCSSQISISMRYSDDQEHEDDGCKSAKEFRREASDASEDALLSHLRKLHAPVRNLPMGGCSIGKPLTAEDFACRRLAPQEAERRAVIDGLKERKPQMISQGLKSKLAALLEKIRHWEDQNSTSIDEARGGKQWIELKTLVISVLSRTSCVQEEYTRAFNEQVTERKQKRNNAEEIVTEEEGDEEERFMEEQCGSKRKQFGAEDVAEWDPYLDSTLEETTWPWSKEVEIIAMEEQRLMEEHREVETKKFVPRPSKAPELQLQADKPRPSKANVFQWLADAGAMPRDSCPYAGNINMTDCLQKGSICIRRTARNKHKYQIVCAPCAKWLLEWGSAELVD